MSCAGGGGSGPQIHTLVGVDGVILDDQTPPVKRAVHTGLAAHLAQVLGGILPPRRRLRDGDAHDVARQELIRGYRGHEGRARLGIAEAEQDIGGGDEEDVLLGRQALGEDGALREGAQEWV